MRRKQHKFKENESRNNLIQPGKELFNKVKGQWRSLYFKNENKLVLELGCGRGEYTVGMAQLFPQKNFVGVDIKGDRIWKGSKTADQMDLHNVGFLRTQIQLLPEFFESDEVNEIWITFPDPRPKKRDIKRRITHPRFLEIYRDLLVPGGKVHLKTDNQVFFDYTMETLQQMDGICDLEHTRDLYQSHLMTGILEIKTHYEQLFSEQGHHIKYLSFRFCRG